MPIRKIVLIQPRHDGRFMGRGISEPYTLMRLASLVDPQIPVEIWDGDLMELRVDQLGPQDLVGISAKTVMIDRTKALAATIQQRGATVVVGGTHVTLVPDEVEAWADVIVVGEGYRTWPEVIRDFDHGTLQKRYVDEEWAPLDSGVAVLQDRTRARARSRARSRATRRLRAGSMAPRGRRSKETSRISASRSRHRRSPANSFG